MAAESTPQRLEVEPTTSGAARLSRVIWPMIVALVSIFAIAGMWWLAAPLGGEETCRSILPAGPGCAPDSRIPNASMWSIAVVLTAGVSIWAGLSRPRLRRAWLSRAAGALAIALALTGYWSVLYS
ncbi:hypothetical protein [Microbacterium album]|nr:hypothetical protein [Microbacterium album]